MHVSDNDHVLVTRNCMCTPPPFFFRVFHSRFPPLPPPPPPSLPPSPSLIPRLLAPLAAVLPKSCGGREGKGRRVVCDRETPPPPSVTLCSKACPAQPNPTLPPVCSRRAKEVKFPALFRQCIHTSTHQTTPLLNGLAHCPPPTALIPKSKKNPKGGGGD